MDPKLIYVIVFLGFTAAGLVIAYPSLIAILRIRRTPTRWISSVPETEGPVEVIGSACIGCNGTSKSPITQTESVLWEVEVTEIKNTGKGSRSETVYKGKSWERFDVSDETGKVTVITTDNTKLILDDDLNTSFDSMTSDGESAVKRLGVKTEGFLGFSKSLRIYERCVRPDEQIFVLGDVEEREGQKVITSGKGGPLIVSDRSEQELLSTLYKKVGVAALFPAIAIGFIILFLIQTS